MGMVNADTPNTASTVQRKWLLILIALGAFKFSSLPPAKADQTSATSPGTPVPIPIFIRTVHIMPIDIEYL